MFLSGKNSWFKSNLLSLYFDKTHFLQLITKNNQENDMRILQEMKRIKNSYNTKLLGLIIGGSLYWKLHINELTSNLNKASYVIRSVKQSCFGKYQGWLIFLMFTLLHYMA